MGGRTERRFWWASLRGGALTAGRKGIHVGAHALLVEAVAAVPQLQQRRARDMDLTAKHQARAAELPAGQHLQLRAQLLPAAEIISWNWIQEHHPIQPR